jgi:hypothetical protein
MAFTYLRYKRSRSGYGNYRYKRYRSYYNYYNKQQRKAIGNYKASLQQKDSTEVNLNIAHKCSTGYISRSIPNVNYDEADPSKGPQNFNFFSGVYAVNIWDLLRKSEFYQSYANMYDQVKITRIQVKCTPVQWTFNTQENNAQQAITVTTAWDRSGLSAEQAMLIAQAVPNGGDNEGIIGLSNNTDGLYLTMNEELTTYSSSKTSQLNPGSSFSITRYLYPSSMQEKSTFINTADLEEWYTKFDGQAGRYYGIKQPNRVYTGEYDPDIPADSYLGYLRTSPAMSGNPCFLLEDPSVAFKPTFLVGCQTGVTNLSQIEQDGVNAVLTGPIVFNLEFDVGVVFRGLRKAKIVE